MEGESLPFIGGKESKLLFTEQSLLERAPLVDDFTDGRLEVFEDFVLECQKIQKILQEYPDSEIISDEVLGSTNGKQSLVSQRIVTDIEEMTGFHRQTNSIKKGKSHGIFQEIFTRLTALGVLAEPPAFEDTQEKNHKDYINYSSSDTFDIHLFFQFLNDPNNPGKNKECIVRINRNPDFASAHKKLSETKKIHEKELDDFRKRYGKIKMKSIPSSKGDSLHFPTISIGAALKEIDRRRQ